jgi:hypothetical protein
LPTLLYPCKRSGFTADYEIRGGTCLGGVCDNDGGAYVITLTALKSGVLVDIVANNGR